MNYKSILISALLLSGSFMTSCSDEYLDTLPSDSTSDVIINSSLENLYLALNGIHSESVSQESGSQALGGEPGFMLVRDISADDMTWSGSSWYKGCLSWSSLTNDADKYIVQPWRIYYQWILNANKILEGLEQVEVTDQSLFNQIKGECLTLRSWSFFMLVQLYADRYDASTDNAQLGIPLRLDSEAKPLARSTVKEVYDQINKDLTEATTLLAGIEAESYGHYTDFVAWGIHSRVALAMQDYTKAAEYAAKSITLAEAQGAQLMSGDQLLMGFANITTDTHEALYADVPLDDQTVYFYSYYAFMSWNFSASAIRGGVKCINADTYDTMSQTDIRRAWWDPTGEAEVPKDSYKKGAYQNRKFTARSESDAVGDVAFMRLAEIYLNQAEALARCGQLDEAQQVFTAFQTTRDPQYVAQASSVDGLITEIMNSRRIELWAEGFRFTDLKRLDEPIKRGRNFKSSFCGFLEKAPGEKGWTWEIPRRETDYNPLCEKNY